MKISRRWKQAIRQTVINWVKVIEKGKYGTPGCPLCDEDNRSGGDCSSCAVMKVFGVSCSGWPCGPGLTDDHAPYCNEQYDEGHVEQCATAACLLAAVCEVEIER